MAVENRWGQQLRKFRVAGGYRSQGAWVESASTLIMSQPIAEFNALLDIFNVEENAFDFSQAMLSRWETGARRPPRERSRHLCLIWVMAQLGCIETSDEADQLLEITDLKTLTHAERSKIWPDIDEANSGSAVYEPVDSPTPVSPSSTLHSSKSPNSIAEAEQIAPAISPLNDWGEAPEAVTFYGRHSEQSQLLEWLLQSETRLIGVWGMGGQGKTTLAAKVSREVASKFDGVIWRSLLNAPPLDEILANWIQGLTNKRIFELPVTLNERLLMLFDLLREHRYLLILDNAESILEVDNSLGRYRPGYEPYGQLVLRFGETAHRSCLLLTSREEPREFTRLRSVPGAQAKSQIQTLQLGGLNSYASEALMIADTQRESSPAMLRLVQQYSGHPLSLILISRTIDEFYGGDIELFLNESPGFFGDIQALLAQHIDRVTAPERAILYWLAIEREPITVQALRSNLVLTIDQSQLMATLRSLQRRSLIVSQQDAQSNIPKFTLQNVVTEFLTDLIVQEACADLMDQGINEWNPSSILHHHALLKATSMSYVRQSQERLILQPVAENLLASMGRSQLRSHMMRRLEQLRAEGITVGYTAGSIINLLFSLHEDLQGFDFSYLPIRQAALESKEVQRASMAYADLTDSVIFENFGRIYSLLFHPSGKFLFAGTTHGQLGVYNAANLHPVEKQTGTIQHIDSLVISRDASTLASSGGDGIVHIWDVTIDPDDVDVALNQTSSSSQKDHPQMAPDDDYLKHRYQFTAEERVRSLAICTNDNYLAVGYMKDIRIWDIEERQWLATLTGHHGGVETLFYVPSSGILASGAGDNTVMLWQIDTLDLSPVAMLRQPSKISRIAVNQDGTLLAVACRNSTIYLWDIGELCKGELTSTLNSVRQVQTFTGHKTHVHDISFDQSGQLLVSCSGDKTIRLWDVASGQTIHLLQGHQAEVKTVQFSPDGSIIVSSSNDRTLRTWDAASGRELRSVGSYAEGSMSDIDFSQNGKSLVSGGDDGTVRIWDLSEGLCRHILREQTNYIFAVAYSPDNQMVASASLDQTICIWDAATGSLRHRLTDHSGEVTSVAYHPTLPLLLSSSNDRTVRLWNVDSGELMHVWNSPGGSVWSVAFSPDGESVAAGSSAGVIFEWSLESKQLMQELVYHSDLVWAIAYSPNGKFMASAGFEGIICLWDMASGPVISADMVHGGWVRSLAFSPDSQYLVSTGDNRDVCLWDVKSCQELYRWPGKDSAAFHPDGNLVASCTDQWQVRLWDPSTGKQVGQLEADGPFQDTNITGVRGISSVQVETLKLMGAVTT